MPPPTAIRYTLALTALFMVSAVSAETYVEPRVFDHSLEFPPLQLSEAIAAGLPTFELKEHTTEVRTYSCIIDEVVPRHPLKVRLLPIGSGSQSYSLPSLLPGDTSTAPIQQSLITRDVDLSVLRLE